jgi:hypothetical protein
MKKLFQKTLFLSGLALVALFFAGCPNPNSGDPVSQKSNIIRSIMLPPLAMSGHGLCRVMAAVNHLLSVTVIQQK